MSSGHMPVLARWKPRCTRAEVREPSAAISGTGPMSVVVPKFLMDAEPRHAKMVAPASVRKTVAPD